MHIQNLIHRKWLSALPIFALVMFAGLGLDLRAHGLVWRFLYSVTGEETPLKQANGFIAYLSNFTRPQPNTATSTPIRDTQVNPLGVNTFLDNEVEPAKRERQMQMIHDAGFVWIRQQFRWDDLEISARGDFTDRRNAQVINAWDKYDNIVGLTQKYTVQIIARLNSPPAWSQSAANRVPGYAPPADFTDYVNYAVTVATRYKGVIHHYQIWNEPNISPEWGHAAPDPEAYTDLLCRTYKALKAVDPSITVITGTLAPTNAIDGQNLNDYVFLQRMYDAGAGHCFDILGVQGYGLLSGPTDHRTRAMDINYSHGLWLRDLMIANGDAAKAIWIGEMAWNPVPDTPGIADKMRFGQVGDEQAARYAIEGYERARTEWPWVGVICYWYFKRADESIKDQSWYYFRLVDPDFTPRPVYDAFKAYALSRRAAQ